MQAEGRGISVFHSAHIDSPLPSQSTVVRRGDAGKEELVTGQILALLPAAVRPTVRRLSRCPHRCGSECSRVPKTRTPSTDAGTTPPGGSTRLP